MSDLLLLLVHMIFLNSSNLRTVCMVMIYCKSKDQPGKVPNPARGQPAKKYFPVPVRA